MENREPQAPRPAARVGTLTFGVVLVVSGSLMLAATFFPRAGPCLGAQTLSPGAHSAWRGGFGGRRGKGQIQYDWVGMLLCCLIVSAALVLFAAAWYLTALPAPLR